MAAPDAEFAPRVTAQLRREVVAPVPDAWLVDEPGFITPDEIRDASVTHLAARARVSTRWLPTHFPGREQHTS
ncbi:hypothetical protein [Streptomyces sp. NPDC053427]|uniref:hypothetical protein n=1 Tax=Streptomyces sp. NPDC053427 TaxID=3365701 RepID=UPI0037D15069